MNTTDTLRAAHALVWQYRAELAHAWPTPNTLDSLRFAVTEAGEALDAYLRTKPEYSRNNARNMSVQDELADCAMMLLTALGPEWDHGGWFGGDMDGGAGMDTIVYEVAHALFEEVEMGGVYNQTILYTASLCIAHVGADFLPRLESRLQRIAARVTEAQHG